MDQTLSNSDHESSWVIANYQGNQAQNALNHAREGIGYYVLSEEHAGKNVYATVGFHMGASDGLMPEHLRTATPEECKKLDHMFASRHPNQLKHEQVELIHADDYKQSVRRDWV